MLPEHWIGLDLCFTLERHIMFSANWLQPNRSIPEQNALSIHALVGYQSPAFAKDWGQRFNLCSDFSSFIYIVCTRVLTAIIDAQVIHPRVRSKTQDLNVRLVTNSFNFIFAANSFTLSVFPVLLWYLFWAKILMTGILALNYFYVKIEFWLQID